MSKKWKDKKNKVSPQRPKRKPGKHKRRAPKVSIQLDKPRHLLYTDRAMVLIEERLGKGFTTKKLQSKPSVDILVVLLLAGLCHEDPELTLDQVRLALNADNIDHVVSRFTLAYGAYRPGVR